VKDGIFLGVRCSVPATGWKLGLWVAKTTQFKRIARRNEQDANEIRIG